MKFLPNIVSFVIYIYKNDWNMFLRQQTEPHTGNKVFPNFSLCLVLIFTFLFPPSISSPCLGCTLKHNQPHESGADTDERRRLSHTHRSGGGFWARSEIREVKWEIKGGEEGGKKRQKEESRLQQRGKMRKLSEMGEKVKQTHTFFNQYGGNVAPW